MKYRRFVAAVVFLCSGLAGLPKVGHGSMDQQSGLEDLPLVEVRPKGTERDILAVLVTGDGGWAVADRGLAGELTAAGIPVVALNSLKYFWTKRTPEEASSALERILRRYLRAWGKKQAVLIGYSLGADVMPFMMNGLPRDVQSVVRAIALMGPSAAAEFEFHLGDWLGRAPGKDAYPVIPEIGKIDPRVAIICIYGEQDEAQICGALDHRRVRCVALPGGHRIGSGYRPVAEAILDVLKDASAGLPDL